MPSDDDELRSLAASTHRALLGSMLAVVLVIALGWARRLPAGDYVGGTVGLLVALAAGYWIFDLFRQGVRER